ncbi:MULTISPECIES: glycosyltransferase [unclassified Clostridium]|uniref:glycosyltransferase family 2 protein n=1 Tax=unclassified Clostridium TaxID=2614128 RepID=UPI001C8B6A06|nr:MULTISPECIES: glycosyltransferase [unclassified Clostridium]MBX9136403.1 glycosyltransferase [Clostridium sp. K12(2020)]MBX9143326.1 glycosyltransferase [Clostridium sp. K13]
MNYPKVSIIMGIYNCEKYLEDSIRSVLNQTFSDWELIMCDDGSSDNTFKIAEKFAKIYPNKIILLKNEKNMGLNYTLNKCLKEAKGEYIARQDGDDISFPERLEKQVCFLNENEEYALVGTQMVLFDNSGEWGRTKKIERPVNNDFIKTSPFSHATCIIRKDIFNEVEGYTENANLLRVEDYHLWFKIYSKGYKGYNIQECLYKMRDNKEAINRRTFKNRKNEAYVKYIGFKMLNMPISKYVYILRPIMLMFIPTFVYKFLHKNKFKRYV